MARIVDGIVTYAGPRRSAPVASLLLGALLLLAPGAAWGQQCTSIIPNDRQVTCADQAWTSISYSFSMFFVNPTIAVTVVGGPASTITAGGGSAGIRLNANAGVNGNQALTVGTMGTVTIVEDSGTSHGIELRHIGSGGTITVDVRNAVIGSMATPMRASGIRVEAGSSVGNVMVTNAGTIHSTQEGIEVQHAGAGTTTVLNSGAIDANSHAIHVQIGGAGTMAVTNSGDLMAAGMNRRGINLLASGNGAITLTLTGGRIESAAAQGVYVESQGTGAIVIQGTPAGAETQSGPTIMAAAHGIYVVKSENTATAGDISVTTTGGAIFAETHGIHVEDRVGYSGDVTIDNAADITADEYGIYVNRAGAGTVSVTHRAGTVLGKTQSGIHAENAGGSLDEPNDDPSDVTVHVMGGMVRSTGQSTDNQNAPAIYARPHGTGDIIVTIAAGATASSKHNAGVFAPLGSYEDGQVKVTQAGAILARTGIYAQVAYNTVPATMDMRVDGAPDNVIDITWTGTFADSNTAYTAADDDERFVAAPVASAVNIAQEVVSEQTMRYGSPAGIEAQVMSWREMMRVAGSEEYDVIPDRAGQLALFDSNAPGSTPQLRAQGAAIVAQFKAALGNGEIDASAAIAEVEAVMPDGGTADGTLSDDEIVAYLSENDDDIRTLLVNTLHQSFSEVEKAILQALATGGDVDAALMAAGITDDAADDDDYWSRVNALLNRYHTGNIRVAMSGGSIASRGDGIRAYYATPNDNNGAIEVTVAAGATVSGAMAGIYVANAGLDAGEAGSDDDILKQSVTVHGMVTGGTDAAVHLVGGGTLTVGEMGVLAASGSQPTVLVNDPGYSRIVVHGEVKGGDGAVAAMDLSGGGSVTVTETGSVNANDNGADAAIRVSGGSYRVAVYAPGTALTQRTVNEAIARVPGGIVTATGGTVADRDGTAGRVSYAVVETAGDYTTGRYLPLALDANGEPVTMGDAMFGGLDDGCPEGQRLDGTTCVRIPPPPPPDMPMEPGPQQPAAPMPPMDCDLTHGDCRLYEAMPSVLLAMNALPSYGERMASARSGNGGWARVETARGDWEADTSTQAGLAYDHDRSGVRAGIDMAVGDGRFGMAVHGLGGTADMAQSGGKIELTGLGVGVNGTAMAGDIYIDAQAAATWFDVDVTSATGTELKDGAKATGLALALEAGRPMALGEGVTVTPRAGFAFSRISLDDFTDARAARRVSLEDASSLVGRLGVGVQTRTPGGIVVAASLDAMQEFSEETEVMFEGARLKASSETTAARVGLSATHSWDEDRYGLQASAGYTAGGGGNSELAGGLSLSIRF